MNTDTSITLGADHSQMSNYHLDPSSIQSTDLTSHTLRSPISSSSNNNHQSNLLSLTSQSNLKAPDHTNNTSNPRKHSSSPSLLRDGSNRLEISWLHRFQFSKDQYALLILLSIQTVMVISILSATVAKIQRDIQMMNPQLKTISTYLTVVGKAPGDSEAFNNQISEESRPDTLADRCHLVLRGETSSAILKICSAMLDAFRESYNKLSIIEVTPPCMVQTQLSELASSGSDPEVDQVIKGIIDLLPAVQQNMLKLELDIHPPVSHNSLTLSDKNGILAEIDYSKAEALAFRTILEEGYDIRLSGQDSGQGAFSQRHALLADQVVEGRTIVPLNQLSAKNSQPGNLEIVNSPLSKYAVLGFELGLSYLTSRLCLTFWEAQFGDFVNTAQVAVKSSIDQ
ncbi:Transketolase, pyrimidine binding domain-domain-containing protein [Phakopsora pachyrhizi]|uniref:Transketolase, pyrimidine binding domain-domain-containing protein n=1 Tax=Phakopsora pachyrhizi TaxID=170000 RepID=A0AAV0B9I3_PHAPC|nr:Transketolase, pyrimidine binding domain-domain-containing protein [Phakopsora pachyrhizi]